MASSSSNVSLFVLESPLLHIQATATDQLLQKYGLSANSAVVADANKFPIFDDLLNNHHPTLHAGGSAQYSARGAQYMLPAGTVVFVGCVGNDRFAGQLRNSAAAAGLKVEYSVDPKRPTGCCAVIITGLNISTCFAPGAAPNYQLAHLKCERVWSLVQRAGVFLVGGIHLDSCPDAVSAIADHAGAKGKTFILTLPSLGDNNRLLTQRVDSIMPSCDYVIGRSDDAKAWARARQIPTTDVSFIAQRIAAQHKTNARRPRTVLITQGGTQAVVAHQKFNSSLGPSVKNFVFEQVEEKIKDTIGAGDAFVGGFAAGVVQGKPIDDCVKMGHWLAKLGMTQSGPSFPMPKQMYSG